MTKQCKLCGITKEVISFSKCTANKDGLQNKCKSCNRKDNQHFREDIQPDYQSGWYKNNRKKWSDYTLDYKRAVNTPTVYGILNPDGEMYVGIGINGLYKIPVSFLNGILKILTFHM